MDLELAHAEVVRALFRGLLKRNGDPDDIDVFVAMLKGGTNFSQLDDVIGTIVGSDEYRLAQRLSEVKAIRKSHLLVSGAGVETFDHVISMGPACYTSSTLERWGLRKFAGPFDWIFSSMRMIEHIFRDDFSSFLSQNYMYRSEIRPNVTRTQHQLYGDMADYPPGHAGAIFYHHDPLADKDYAHFLRIVGRMRKALSGRCLLVNLIWNTPGQIEAFGNLASYLTDVAPGAKLVTVLADAPVKADAPEMQLWWKLGVHEAYHLRPIDQLGESGFYALSDEIAAMKVVLNHSFQLKIPEA